MKQELITIDEFGQIVERKEIDAYLWEQILQPYVSIQNNDQSFGECIELIHQNLHNRCNLDHSNTKIIDTITESNKIYAYLLDVCGGNVLQCLKSITSNSISTSFLSFLDQNHCNRCNLIDFLDNHYTIQLTKSDLAVDIWTKMRPLSDIGKTRGYSGPAELPLLMFAGGSKAKTGDIVVNGQQIEVKGEGGRIGSASSWCSSKQQFDRFFDQFGKNAQKTSMLQTEFDFSNELASQFADHIDYSVLPHSISVIYRRLVAKQLIKTREDAIILVGVLQLIEYIRSKHDDWFLLFKHPGKNSAPFGTSFIINCKTIKLTARCVKNMFNSIKNAQVSFSPCYDSDGFKIKFVK